MRVGIPKSLVSYYYKDKWKYFLEKLDIEVVESINTNKEIIDLGISKSNDEMCMSLKTYLGHIAYLEDKCNYILIPRIDNYGLYNQTCTNFLAVYDIANNLFKSKILNYNIDYMNGDNEYKGFKKIGKELNKNVNQIKKAYQYACIKCKKDLKRLNLETMNKLYSNKLKILVVGHSYNLNDELIGNPIIQYLEKEGCEVIKSCDLPHDQTNALAHHISKTLYWKYNKENIGAIPFSSSKVDGIILLSSFPCGPDSIVNELVLRRVKTPIINIIIDDISAFSGIETRLESFIDILKQKNY